LLHLDPYLPAHAPWRNVAPARLSDRPLALPRGRPCPGVRLDGQPAQPECAVHERAERGSSRLGRLRARPSRSPPPN